MNIRVYIFISFLASVGNAFAADLIVTNHSVALKDWLSSENISYQISDSKDSSYVMTQKFPGASATVCVFYCDRAAFLNEASMRPIQGLPVDPPVARVVFVYDWSADGKSEEELNKELENLAAKYALSVCWLPGDVLNLDHKRLIETVLNPSSTCPKALSAPSAGVLVSVPYAAPCPIASAGGGSGVAAAFFPSVSCAAPRPMAAPASAAPRPMAASAGGGGGSGAAALVLSAVPRRPKAPPALAEGDSVSFSQFKKFLASFYKKKISKEDPSCLSDIVRIDDLSKETDYYCPRSGGRAVLCAFG